jgi:FkbM family methyltransferase
VLRANLERNRLGWVRPHPVALSDRRGTAVLNLNPVNDGGHSLGDFTDNPDLQGWDRERLKAEVETDTLDDVVQREAIGTPHLIKIDVEGAETLVFAGGQRTLSGGQAPMIVCEVGDAAQRQFGKTERQLREQLYAHGYRSYLIARRLREFGPETPVAGLPNVLFAKQLPARLRPLVR